MAKTGGNFERCNVGSVEAHNLRTPEYLKGVQESGRNLYFFQDLTKKNTSYVNPTYEGKTCSQIFQDLVQLYKSKIGQMPQLKDREWIDKKTGKKKKRPGWSPIREAVIPIKADTTLEDFDKLVAWLRQKGVEVIRLDLHKDEGYENLTGKRKMNYHAHLVVDWIDHKTANTAKLTPADMSEFQTMCALSLDMERGTPKTVTNKEHLNSAEYREKAAERHLAEMTGAGAKVAAFFGVGELAEIRRELKEAKEERDVAVKDKEAAQKALQDANEAHSKQLAKEKEKSRQEGISEAVAAVKKAADLHITGKDGKETAEDIGKAWRSAFNQKKKVEEQLKNEKEKNLQRKDPIEAVNGLLSLLNISKVDSIKDIEEVTGRLQKVRNVESFFCRERNELCAAIMAWGDQKECDINSPKALQVLRQLFEAMLRAWNALVSTARKIAAEHVLQPEYIFRNKDLVDVVNLQLHFTPGACFRYTSGWEEALTMGVEKYLAPFKERIDQARLQSMQQEQQDIEEDIEEEETQSRGWHI